MTDATTDRAKRALLALNFTMADVQAGSGRCYATGRC